MFTRFTRRDFVVGSALGTIALCTHGSRAVAGVLGLAQQGAPSRASSAEDLDSFIRSRMESAHVPGLSLAVIRDGTLQRTTGFGFANLAQRRPMRADTIINVASITKTVTCLAVMQLWERKKFDLDSDVNSYLSFPVRNPAHPAVPLTFRQLLTHTSSITDGPAYEKSYACGDSRVPLGQWLRDYLTARGALYDSQRNFHPREPGTQTAYSNVAYGLLGHLVETLSDLSYSEYMLKRVFAPLGMTQSRILLAGMNPQSHATPYTYASDRNVATVELRDPSWTPPASPTGGVQVPHCLYSFGTPPDGLARTSAVELSRLLRAFMNGGELEGQRVLQSNTVAQILSGQGLTWHRYGNLGPGIAWGHNGGDPGVSTLAVFRPQDRRGVVILTNSDGGGETASQIAQRVLG